MSWWTRALFDLPDREVSFRHRGFVGGSPAKRERLESVGRSFLQGYRAALYNGGELEATAESLQRVEEELRGFATEGAAFYLALTDALSPWRKRRYPAFAASVGAPYIYMVQVAAGMPLGRLPLSIEGTLGRLHPLLRWLAIDGYGFYEGFFNTRRSFDQRRVPRRLRGYARRAFDQGLGRSLWFARVADPAAVAHTIGAFSPPRRGDLWAGVGLASVYAGGTDESLCSDLKLLAGEHQGDLAQGAAFAAKARLRGGFVPDHTATACRVLTGQEAAAAAEVTDWAADSLGDLSVGWTRRPQQPPEPLFETWRRRIRGHLMKEVMTSCA
ncbi:MAG: DUF1702 family protein [Acidobacteriota bacterium]